jgi:hypothetical protein
MKKAFWKITGWSTSIAIPAPIQVQLTARNVFGLPYALKDKGAAVSFGWNNISYLGITSVGAAEGDYNQPVGNPFLTVADYSTPSNITGDIRGTVSLETVANIGGIAINAPDGIKNLFFSFYVQGSDVNQNQRNAMYYGAVNALNNNIYPGVWEAGIGTNVDLPTYNNRLPIPQLNVSDFYGLTQYYTGVAA